MAINKKLQKSQKGDITQHHKYF